jgi:hypothetical protein
LRYCRYAAPLRKTPFVQQLEIDADAPAGEEFKELEMVEPRHEVSALTPPVWTGGEETTRTEVDASTPEFYEETGQRGPDRPIELSL